MPPKVLTTHLCESALFAYMYAKKVQKQVTNAIRFKIIT